MDLDFTYLYFLRDPVKGLRKTRTEGEPQIRELDNRNPEVKDEEEISLLQFSNLLPLVSMNRINL
jgi:hypothetical protein